MKVFHRSFKKEDLRGHQLFEVLFNIVSNHDRDGEVRSMPSLLQSSNRILIELVSCAPFIEIEVFFIHLPE